MKIELTNMVMIQDIKNGKVVVQEREKSWKGIAFPGGHVEEGESFVDSAIREVKEETGLDVINLKSCGLIHWNNNKTYDRYMIFLYKTVDFKGTLIDRTEEGKVFWTSIDDIYKMNTATNFKEYLQMFLNDTYSEAFGSWNKDEDYKIIYK
ncbi:MAG: hydrolase [Clostridia bacterium]|jgi:8-oxo-dGTP diphosphatase|nr:hydrolase [Clostridia bacterium]